MNANRYRIRFESSPPHYENRRSAACSRPLVTTRMDRVGPPSYPRMFHKMPSVVGGTDVVILGPLWAGTAPRLLFPTVFGPVLFVLHLWCYW
jgi:hypothetical protein